MTNRNDYSGFRDIYPSNESKSPSVIIEGQKAKKNNSKKKLDEY
jgi:hypothetical protein